MIDHFVTLCLKRRQVVWLIAILMAIFGYSSWKALKIEATCAPVAPAPITIIDGGIEVRPHASLWVAVN